MSVRNNLRDKLEDGELDLSMMQLVDVPVREIEQLGTKVTALNLSHNLLSSLPANLPLLTHITKLDLSKNQLTDLPENFGQLRALKSLDLYANRIEKLPVSFSQLKSLKWLDLKDNPLCPALKQAAGDCITPNDCAMCAKKVVALLQSYDSQLQRERQRKLEEEMKAQREMEKKEEVERERIRQEKRAAKEKRREEARMREAEVKKETDLKISQEMQMNGNGVGYTRNSNGSNNLNYHHNGHSSNMAQPHGKNCLGSILMFLLGLAVAGLGLAISLLWIYTEGKLDAKSVSTALPVIQADIEETLLTIGKSTSMMYEEVEKMSKPYLESAIKNGKTAWNEGGKQIRVGAKYLEENFGEFFNQFWSKIKEMAQCLSDQIIQAWKQILPHLKEAWETSKPYFHELGKIIIEKTLEVWKYLLDNFPVYMEMLTQTCMDVAQYATKTWQKISEAF